MKRKPSFSTPKLGRALLAALALSSVTAMAVAENLHWNAAGTPSDSFELTDGPTPDPQPGDQVFTATNTCDDSTVRATFGNPDSVADPGEPFVNLRAADTIDWWIDGAADNDEHLTLTLEFLGDPVEDLSFTVYDIDNGGWIDEYSITGTFVGAVTVNATTCGSSISCVGSGTTELVATGTAGATFGDAAGNLVVDIPGPVQTVSIEYRAADTGSLTGDQLTGISDMSFTCSTVPVTLASFRSESRAGMTRFHWTTASETSNVGFHLYGEVDGDWRQLNRRLIPSQSIDSLEPRSYSTTLRSRGATRFAISDVDTRGREEMHGPFELGAEAGSPATAQPIDWESIRERSSRLAAARSSARAFRESSTARLKASNAGNALVASSGSGTPTASGGGYELRVAETGLYRVPSEAVPALAGVPLEELALTRNGRAVRARVVGGDSSGVFGPGSFVEFYGEALSTLYTRTNVYRLEADASSARRPKESRRSARKAPLKSYQATVEVERDLAYSFAAPNGDPWYEARILAYDKPVTKTFEFEVTELLHRPAVLELDLWGVTDWTDRNPDHHISVSVNGYPVADERFDGLSALELSIPLAAGTLIEGKNTVEITSLGDTGARYDLIHIDGYGATFGRRMSATHGRFTGVASALALEVSGFETPNVVAYRFLGRNLLHIPAVRVEPDGAGGFSAQLPGSARREHTYVVWNTEQLLTPEIAPLPEAVPIDRGPAEYLVISHPDFIDHLGPLVAARSADGLSVKVVDVEQIYLQYGGGVFSPNAIRAYIRHMSRQGGTRYVLLVGGDSYDYLDNLGLGSISFIPTFYEATHSVVHFAPSDAALADAAGDGRPDVAIGRFPVRTPEELELMIGKTLAYAPGGKALFAADAKDGAISFAEISDKLSHALDGMSIEPVYVDDLGLDASRAKLLAALDSGVGLTHYFGHSAPSAWTFSGLLGTADAEALQNHGRPTVALQWGCWSGYHSVPRSNTLSHALLLSGTQGAAAVLGASGLTEVASDQALAEAVYRRLAVPGTRLGDALQGAKEELSSSYRDVQLGMTLLGDPALVVN